MARGGGSFHGINCSNLNALADSELFGHTRGAFTGAERDHAGALEQAGDGMLLLDEVGEMPPLQQPKLLRVLERRQFQRLGDDRWIPFRARVVAATHVDLAERVRQGLFREDLFERLAVHVVLVPPLRDRTEDLDELVAAMLRTRGVRRRFTPEAMMVLAEYAWPGNVRRLGTLVERVAAYCPREVVDAAEVRRYGLEGSASKGPGPAPTAPHAAHSLDALLAAYERAHIVTALVDARDNVSEAARALGLGRERLRRRMSRLGIGYEPLRDSP